MLHHGGMRKEEVSERTFVASTMQHTRVLRLERCFQRGVASWWPVGGIGQRADVCCIVDATQQDFEAGEMFLERCCIMVACGRKREASRHLLHQRCNTLGFRGWRDESGEVLHHGGLQEEEVSERMFVALLMQHTRISRLERCYWRDVASRWHAKGRISEHMLHLSQCCNKRLQTMPVGQGTVLRRENCHSCITSHGCNSAAANYTQEKGKRRGLQLKEMLHQDNRTQCIQGDIIDEVPIHNICPDHELTHPSIMS